MTVTVNTQTILFILAILGCIALVFLIIVLKKLANLISSIDDLIVRNSTNVGLTIAKLPSIVSSVDDVVDNAKDITDVAVDVSSDVLVAKEKIKSGIKTSIEVAGIVKDVMKKK